jgi:hypothetical protein
MNAKAYREGFLDLEPDICDLLNMAHIVAMMVNDRLCSDKRGVGNPEYLALYLTEEQKEALCFGAYQAERMARQLKEKFYRVAHARPQAA